MCASVPVLFLCVTLVCMYILLCAFVCVCVCVCVFVPEHAHTRTQTHATPTLLACEMILRIKNTESKPRRVVLSRSKYCLCIATVSELNLSVLLKIRAGRSLIQSQYQNPLMNTSSIKNMNEVGFRPQSQQAITASTCVCVK